jgi:predicted nicotinamide N-methyase
MRGVRVRYQTVEFGELDFHLRALRDRQQCDDHTELAESFGISSATWPLFGVLWPAEEFLAHLMLEEDLGGRRILEVGCGLALASLVLKSRGADITATDHHPEAHGFLDANTRLNELGAIPFERASWNDTESDLGRFDLVIASDLLYDHHDMKSLVGFLDTHTSSMGEVLVVDPRRGLTGPFIRQLVACGFSADVVDMSYATSEGDEGNYLAMRFARSG